MKSRPSVLVTMVITVVGVLAALLAVALHPPQERVRFATTFNPHSPVPGNILPGSSGWPYNQRLAADWGVDHEFGFSFEMVPRLSGKLALRALLDRNADIAFMAATPLVTAISRGEDVVVLAQIDKSHRQIRLVTSRKHAQDWYLQPIGVIRGTSFEPAAVAMLRASGHLLAYREGKIEFVEVESPSALMNLLLAGDVASSVLTQPHAALLTLSDASSAEPRFVDITPPNVYRFTGYLVTTKDQWNASRDGILKAVQATARTREMIAQDPQRRLKQIHDSESGNTRLRDEAPLFWTQDELAMQSNLEALRADLTYEAELQIAAGMIDSVPDFSSSLSLVNSVAAKL